MDALRHLIANIPDWLKRLEDLNGQIEIRQQELATLAESQARAGLKSATKAIRNHGSTESLKPRDEPAANPFESATPDKASARDSPQLQTPAEIITAKLFKNGGAPPDGHNTNTQCPPSPGESITSSTVQRQVVAAGQARARKVLRKPKRTESMMSVAEGVPKYPSQSMIIVYYDSYVQTFFNELVKFVSGSRNMMRKAKMAARVAQIKRLAEMSQDDDQGADLVNPDSAIGLAPGLVDGSGHIPSPLSNLAPPTPSAIPTNEVAVSIEPASISIPPVANDRLHMNTSSCTSASGTSPYACADGLCYRRSGYGGFPQVSEIYNQLDKGLEYIQNMSEKAAHQFLRDGDCADEVSCIQKRLGQTKSLADEEMERIESDPEALKAAEEGQMSEMKGRVLRPQKMVREWASPAHKALAPAAQPAPVLPKQDDAPLEVDEGIDDCDDDEPIPVLRYKRAG